MSDKFAPLEDASAFRRMAAAMWRRPNDPSIYGSVDIDATKALALVDAYRARGVRLTMTHVVARAIAIAIARHPDVNCKVRFWGRLERRRSVDVFLTVATGGGRDLSGARVNEADKKSLAEIAAEVRDKSARIRDGSGAPYEKSRNLFRAIPWWLGRPAVALSSLITNELHLDLPQYGMPLDPFGSAMVTSVGMFGVDTAFAPFTPIARVPILVLVAEVRPRPWVEGDAIVVRPVLRLCATFDHRILDGYHAGLLSREVSTLLTDPAQLDPDAATVPSAASEGGAVAPSPSASSETAAPATATDASAPAAAPATNASASATASAPAPATDGSAPAAGAAASIAGA